MSAALVTPSFRLLGSLCDSPAVEITGKRLMADAADVAAAAALLADPAVEGEIAVIGEGAGDDIETKSIPGSDDDDAASVVSIDSVVCDGGGLVSVSEDLLASVEAYDIGNLSSVSDGNSIVAGVEIGELGSSLLTDQKVPSILEGVRPSFLLKEYVPLWGTMSICGRRPEMEDAVTVVPWFHEIPLQMLIGNRLIDGVNPNTTCLPAHFFGVYDGHGGAQVTPLFLFRYIISTVQNHF